MFIVSLSYKKEIAEVEKFIEAHIQFLDKHYADKKFIFSGRKIHEQVELYWLET